MRSFHLTVFTLLALLAACPGRAQVDPHFSQYYVYPMWLNPALTGAIVTSGAT